MSVMSDMSVDPKSSVVLASNELVSGKCAFVEDFTKLIKISSFLVACAPLNVVGLPSEP